MHDVLSLSQHSNDPIQPRLAAADVTRHQRTYAITSFEGFIRIQPVLGSVAMLFGLRRKEVWPESPAAKFCCFLIG